MSGALLTVMVYDVADDARRRKVHALFKQYGVAMQESAFEGRLTVNERARVVARVGRLLDLKADRFVMYTVPKDHEERIEELGVPRPKVEENGFWMGRRRAAAGSGQQVPRRISDNPMGGLWAGVSTPSQQPGAGGGNGVQPPSP